jgi:hypothetical protein
MLKWLAGQGVSVQAVQREWQAGAIKDATIAMLIRRAAGSDAAQPVTISVAPGR